jgi:hypothetical protein
MRTRTRLRSLVPIAKRQRIFPWRAILWGGLLNLPVTSAFHIWWIFEVSVIFHVTVKIPGLTFFLILFFFVLFFAVTVRLDGPQFPT